MKNLLINIIKQDNLFTTPTRTDDQQQIPTINTCSRSAQSTLLNHPQIQTNNTYDNFNMNLPNYKQPPTLNTMLPPFLPWSTQPHLPFQATNPLARLTPLSPSYPLALYFQQQNNYYNTNIVHPSLPFPPLLQPPRVQQPSLSLPSSELNLHSRSNHPKAKTPVICLEIQSSPQIIVISESEDDFPSEKNPQVALKSSKVQIQSFLKKKYRLGITKKDEYGYSQQKNAITENKEGVFQNKSVSLQPRCVNAKQQAKRGIIRIDIKKEKTKMIKKRSWGDRFIYKLTPHEKQLSRLSDCREYLPGQVMVGPQFQAILPRFSQCVHASASRLQRKLLISRRQSLLSRLIK